MSFSLRTLLLFMAASAAVLASLTYATSIVGDAFYTVGLLTIAVAVAAVAGVLLWPRRFDPELIWLLSIPGTLEYVAEQLGLLRYRARRQMIATALTAIPLGRGLSYEFEHRWSWYFWGPLLVFGTIWFIATIVGRRTRLRASL